MTLQEFIKTNKIHKDKFIAIYNKDKVWIICGQQDDVRLVDYMNLTVTESADVSAQIVRVYTNYEQNMQIAYYKMKAEQAESAARFSGRDSSASESKQRRSSQRKKVK